MEVLYPRCCGLDVHKSSITACVLIAQPGKPLKSIRRFGCTTRELRELVAWLQEFGVQHVAMESTGVYWKPVWNVLESQFQIVLAKSTAHQGRSRTQDGHEGLSVDRGTFATRTAAGQLHTPVGDSRSA
jgi:transposase